jgi:hypothetical protein
MGRSGPLGRIGEALELALRSGAAPVVLGARLAERLRQPHPPDLPPRQRGFALASKVALDEFFFTTEILSASFVSLRDHRRMARELRDALALFARRGWLDDPASYHRDPPALEIASVDELRSHWLPHRHLRFESGYEPHAGEPGRARWLGYAANRSAHVRLLKHPGRARPWLVCIPGYRMGHALVDFAGFRVRWLHRTLGLNVAIPVMPLHGPRRVGRRGGDGFFTGDFIDTIHAQAQSIWDVRRLVGWLRAQGAPAVGVYGLSLGGYTAALLASLERELDCAVVGIPTTDFMRLLRAHLPGFVERAALRVGLSFSEIERLLRVISPLALAPQIARERRFVFAGLADQLAAPHHAHDLWHHWEKPRVAWYHGSHISFLWEAEVKALLEEAFAATGLLRGARSEGSARERGDAAQGE